MKHGLNIDKAEIKIVRFSYKAVLFLISFVMLVLGVGCSETQISQETPGKIEFIRPENDGFVNIVPCTVILNDHRTIKLSGGESAVVSIPAGNFSIRVISIDPYTTNSTANSWSSGQEQFHISGGEKICLFIDLCSSGSAYTGGWIVSKVQTGI